MIKRKRIAWAVLAAVVVAAAGCARKVYTVNLSPRSEVGWKFSLSSDLAETSQSRIVENIPNVTAPQSHDDSSAFTGHLEGDGEVLAVYPNGGIAKLAVTVRVLHATRGGQDVPNLPGPGAVITVGRQGDKIAISVNGKSPDEAVSEAINELILLDDDEATMQDLFGAKQPVGVGDTWPVSAKAVQTVLQNGLGGQSAGTEGTMKLESVEGEGANQLAVVHGTFSIDDYKPSITHTMKLDNASLQGTMVWTVPLGTPKGPVKLAREVSMKITSHGTPNNVPLTLTMTGDQKRSLELDFR